MLHLVWNYRNFQCFFYIFQNIIKFIFYSPFDRYASVLKKLRIPKKSLGLAKNILERDIRFFLSKNWCQKRGAISLLFFFSFFSNLRKAFGILQFRQILRLPPPVPLLSFAFYWYDFEHWPRLLLRSGVLLKQMFIELLGLDSAHQYLKAHKLYISFEKFLNFN